MDADFFILTIVQSVKNIFLLGMICILLSFFENQFLYFVSDLVSLVIYINYLYLFLMIISFVLYLSFYAIAKIVLICLKFKEAR